MKKYTVHIILAVVIIVIAVVIGCKYFNKEDSSVSSNSVASSEPVVTATPEPTPTIEPTAEPTEAPHEHVYTETVTTEATCETDGLKTFACECGDSYTEVITATGHVFENYIYNEDATYLADGTQTATCVCGLTDTQTAIGSKLEYTFTFLADTMYAQQTVNVRNLPCTDGEKIGSLSTNEVVVVMGRCNETGWYKIGTDDITGYVSDSYLGTSKVIVSNSGGGSSSSQTQSYTFIAPNGDVIKASRPITWEDIAPSDEGFLYTNNTDIVIYINGDRCSPGGSTLKLMDGGDGGDIVGPDINWNY